MTHYFSEKQTSKPKLKIIKATLRNKTLNFYTASGTFSIKKIDKGTQILIQNMVLKPQDIVLDLGCGYGPIGLFAALFTKEVYLLDINKRAVKITKMNAKLNNITNVKVLQGNLYEPIKTKKFNTILTNPPQTAGKEICFKFIEQAKQHIKLNGSLQLVARHNKGGKVLEQKMKETFGNVKTLAKKSGYRVYVSKIN